LDFQSEKECIDHLEAEAASDGDHVGWLRQHFIEAKGGLDPAAAQKDFEFLKKRRAEMRYKEDIDRQRVAAAALPVPELLWYNTPSGDTELSPCGEDRAKLLGSFLEQVVLRRGIEVGVSAAGELTRALTTP